MPTTSPSTPTSSGYSCNTATDSPGPATGPSTDRRAVPTPRACGEFYEPSSYHPPGPALQPAQPNGLGHHQRGRGDEPVGHAAHAQPAHRQELPDAGCRDPSRSGRTAARPEHRQIREQLPGSERIRPHARNPQRPARGRHNLATLPRTGAVWNSAISYWRRASKWCNCSNATAAAAAQYWSTAAAASACSASASPSCTWP